MLPSDLPWRDPLFWLRAGLILTMLIGWSLLTIKYFTPL